MEKILKIFGITSLIVAILLTSLGGYTVANVISIATPLQSQGNLVSSNQALKLFDDKALTTPKTRMDWGSVTYMVPKTMHMWIVDNGSYPLSLSMTSTNWVPPEMQANFTLSWDAEKIILKPSEMVQANITLTLIGLFDSATARNFNFNIVISGMESLKL